LWKGVVAGFANGLSGAHKKRIRNGFGGALQTLGAPSSMAVSVARGFDRTRVGFLRDDHFNAYHGGSHIMADRRAEVREAR